VFRSDVGGGVTMGGGDVELPGCATDPCIVGRAGGLELGVMMTRPAETDGVACDESRLGRTGAAGAGAGVTKGGACETPPALAPTSRIAAASHGASARRIAKEHAISRSASVAGTTRVRPAPYTP
jgi:hypothetical protein